MSASDSAALAPGRGPRDRFIAAVLRFLSAGDFAAADRVRSLLERELDTAGPEALARLKARLAEPASTWDYYPPDPLARRLHHVLADRLLESDSSLAGASHAAEIAGRPVVVFANHLSYADANLIEILLHRGGAGELADRLIALAGPKIYTSRQRRFSSLCYGTIRVPQNTAVSSGEAVMNARDVARAARQSIDAALSRVGAGGALLLFGEGTRSRSRGMQPMLAGVTRYLDRHDPWILPVSVIGTDGLFPVDQDVLHPVRVVVTIGRPFQSVALRRHATNDKRVIVDAIGIAVAELLPADYRGAYADATAVREASSALAAARSAV